MGDRLKVVLVEVLAVFDWAWARSFGIVSRLPHIGLLTRRANNYKDQF